MLVFGLAAILFVVLIFFLLFTLADRLPNPYQKYFAYVFLVASAIEANGAAVRHGMVSFPLTTIHPWAFRAASATWCVGAQQSDLLLPFKELFYSLQRDMQVSLVTPTAVDFATGNGLDDGAFRSCYLRSASIDAVHRQIELGTGNRLQGHDLRILIFILEKSKKLYDI